MSDSHHRVIGELQQQLDVALANVIDQTKIAKAYREKCEELEETVKRKNLLIVKFQQVNTKVKLVAEAATKRLEIQHLLVVELQKQRDELQKFAEAADGI